MSWDVVMIRTESNSEPLDEIELDGIVPFSRTEVAGAVEEIAEAVGAAYHPGRHDDLAWLNLDGDGWSVEFILGDEPETESVMLCIRGAEPTEVLTALQVDLDTRLFDCGSGDFIVPGQPTSFEEWKAYRDKVLGLSADA